MKEEVEGMEEGRTALSIEKRSDEEVVKEEEEEEEEEEEDECVDSKVAHVLPSNELCI